MRLFLGAIMKLIGSNPSPFARRVRMWAAQNNVDLALVNLDIFSEQDRPTLASNNPGRKIPVLIDGDLTLSDSTIILRYLIAKAGKTPLSWSQEHLLNIINACNDSLVELALSRRSGFDTSDDKLFFNLQNERIAETLSYLNSHFNDAILSHTIDEINSMPSRVIATRHIGLSHHGGTTSISSCAA